MKLFSFRNPRNLSFAQASRLGTWYPLGIKVCPECGDSRQQRVPPLILEWEPGSDRIGDFTWPGFNDEVVIGQIVRDVLEAQFPEISFGLVTYWQNPHLKRPLRQTRRYKPRVWLPYTGPMLWEIITQKWCHLDHQRLDVTLEKQCSTCGKVIYKLPPWSHQHVVVDSLTWDGADIFRIYEYAGAIYCTEKVKGLVEHYGFSNVTFVENGEILDQL